MKSPKITIFAALLTTLFTTLALAQVASNDYLMVKKGEVTVHKGGKSSVLKEKLELSNGYQVETNGVITLKDGTEKTLKAEQRLSLDGFLIAANGRLISLEDHITYQGGTLSFVKDGVATPARGVVTLNDGSRVFPTGVIIRPDGKRKRLLDGQMIRQSGSRMAGNDFVTVRKGQVIIQKDGSVYTLKPRRTMMMADGTKVFADGRIQKSDKSTIRLEEGQRYNLPGAHQR